MPSPLRPQPFATPEAAPTDGEASRAPPGAVTAGLPHASVWRASQLGHGSTAALSSGFASLDAELPGNGWPLGMLTELIAREAGIGELRLMVPLLRQLTRERRTVLLLAPPHIPYAPALASFGVDLEHLLIVQAPNAADRLWAVEQTLRSASFGALLAWLPQEKTRPEHLRRLQLAAQSAQGPVFLFRSLAAQFESSPAPLRLLLLPKSEQRLSVQLLKRRGPVLANPMLVHLPQPVSAIRLRPRPVQNDPHTTGRSLTTVHAPNPRQLPVALH
jgi:protein ImuA